MIRQINNNYMGNVAGGMRFENEDGYTQLIFDNAQEMETFLNFLKAADQNRSFAELIDYPDHAQGLTIGDTLARCYEENVLDTDYPIYSFVNSNTMQAFKNYYETPVEQRPTQDITW